MLILFLFLNVIVVLLCIVLRYSPAVLPYAVPFPFTAEALVWLAGIVVAAIIAAFAACRIKGRSILWRPLAELLLIFPPLFWLIWTKLPPVRNSLVDWIPFAILFIIFLLLFYADGKNRHHWGLSLRNFAPSLRSLAFPTLIMAALPIVAAIFVGTEFKPVNAIIGFLTYPFYAFAQLLLFLVFPVRRFEQITDSRIEIVIALAGLFALLHWPNGITMLCGGIAMAVWAAVYLRHPNLYTIALSMGFVAVIYTQVLPDRLTHHVRVGPNFVYTRMVTAQPEETWEVAGRLVQSSAYPEDQSGSDEEFIGKMYDGLLGRAPSPDRLNFWVKIASDFGRPNALRSFLRSSDFKPRGFRNWREPLTSKLDFQGCLDELRLGNKMILLLGWSANIKTGELPDSIFVFVNGERVKSGRLGTSRKDVADFFGVPSLEKSGFEIRFGVADFPQASTYEVRLFAVSSDRILMELSYIAPNKFTLSSIE